MGATKLGTSLSAPSTCTVSEITWPANKFLKHFFDWLANKVDVDGDGQVTLLDAYRSAGVMTMDSVLEAKKACTWAFAEMQVEIEAILHAIAAAGRLLSEIEKVDLVTRYKAADQKLEIMHTQQEPWILNPDRAREWQFP